MKKNNCSFLILPIGLVNICRPSGGKKEKKKEVNVGSTKFQLPDDIRSDNRGKQAILSMFHHIMWPT